MGLEVMEACAENKQRQERLKVMRSLMEDSGPLREHLDPFQTSTLKFSFLFVIYFLYYCMAVAAPFTSMGCGGRFDRVRQEVDLMKCICSYLDEVIFLCKGAKYLVFLAR